MSGVNTVAQLENAARIRAARLAEDDRLQGLL